MFPYVVGLGISGRSVMQYLQQQKISFYCWDDNAQNRPDIEECRSPNDVNWLNITHLILSPGISHTWPKPHLAALKAKQHLISIISDVDLLWAEPSVSAYTVGVTGTNGKSTTAALMQHVLRLNGETFVGGNFGPPALKALEAPYKNVVLELSSFQLDITKSAGLDAAVLLNITTDHIERYGGLPGYVASKLSIFSKLKPGGTAIICTDSLPCGEIFSYLQMHTDLQVIGYSSDNRANEIDTNTYTKLCELANTATLNKQNLIGAYLVAHHKGIPFKQFEEQVLTYQGLAHRQEVVCTHKNVTFINDSKATNIVAANAALCKYNNLFWLGGGVAKEPSFDELETNNITKAYIFGEAASLIEKTLVQKSIPYRRCRTLDEATQWAYEDALKSEAPATVLLSPACASYDQFQHFVERGNVFKAAVKQIVMHTKEATHG